MSNDISEFVQTTVEYDFNELGYIVQVIQEGDILDEYTAGNSPFDSQVTLAEGGLSIETIEKYAKQTANDFMSEYKADSVQHNNELLADW